MYIFALSSHDSNTNTATSIVATGKYASPQIVSEIFSDVTAEQAYLRAIEIGFCNLFSQNGDQDPDPVRILCPDDQWAEKINSLSKLTRYQQVVNELAGAENEWSVLAKRKEQFNVLAIAGTAMGTPLQNIFLGLLPISKRAIADNRLPGR